MEEHCCLCECYPPFWRQLGYWLAVAIPTGAAVYYWCKKKECEKRFKDFQESRELVDNDSPPQSPKKVRIAGDGHHAAANASSPTRGRSPNGKLRQSPSRQFMPDQSQMVSHGTNPPNSDTELDSNKLTHAIACLTKSLKCTNARLGETEQAVTLLERQMQILIHDSDLIKGQLGIQPRSRRSPENY